MIVPEKDNAMNNSHNRQGGQQNGGRYDPRNNNPRYNRRQYNAEYNSRYSRQPQQNGGGQRKGSGDPDGAVKGLMVLLCGIMTIIAIFYISCSMCGGCGSCGACAEKEEPAPPVQSQQQEEPQIATVRVTFPEGFNVRQIAQRLEENGVCSASDLYETMNSVDFSEKYTFLPPLIQLEDRDYHLEGYMFPDTYDFFVGESAQSVIGRFLSNFDARVTQELRQAALSTGEFYNVETDLDDIVIMASIVEREINVPEEMDGVAAVFWNRIKHPGGTGNGAATGGFFQSDATK